MKIVIIGDGKVGHKLTAQLSEEDYDVVLIDQNQNKLMNAVNQMDIICIHGNGADVEILKQADVPNADMLIACTSMDELNLLACLFAKRLGAKHTIARVRNPIYFEQLDLLKGDLHLSMAINPELTAADEIARVLLFPEASKVETFMKGRVELIEYVIKENSLLVGMPLAELYKTYQIKMLICAVRRGDEVFIPDGNFVLQAGDKIHITASRENLRLFFKKMGHRLTRVKKVIICGGGHVCYYLARRLLQAKMQVKIIEINEKRCEELCETLPEATIINGDASEQALLLEEGAKDADAIISLTGMDEENIIISLFGVSLGVEKIVAKVNEDNRARMVAGLGIDSIVSAKTATANTIMRYVRARKNSYSSENVETMYRLIDGQVEALEFIIKKSSEYVGIPLKDLKLKSNNLIACIGRKRRIIIPNGDSHLEVGDSVIIVTRNRSVNSFRDILK